MIIDLDIFRCCHCNKILEMTRTDKLFCDDKCRNDFHRARNSDPNSLKNKILNAFKKNERILKDCFDFSRQMPPVVLRNVLDHYGFDYKAYTSSIFHPEMKVMIKWTYYFGWARDPENVELIRLCYRTESGSVIPTILPPEE